jgi:predicted CoA-substrate-specific enzyme activase
MQNYYVGIDIGSTAAKVAVLDDNGLVEHFSLPTGWNGKETAEKIYAILNEKGYADGMSCVATGYGRVCVDYADRVITEITCHGKGGYALFQKDCIIIDVGGQDTKIIQIADGQVKDFLMNDKCAAGTGKFIEIMATRLGAGLEEMYELAAAGEPVAISSMCTVFAESEVIGHIGSGKHREDIAAGVIDSVASRVANLLTRYGGSGDIVLTGGLCDSPYFIRILSEKTGRNVESHPDARYAGALGAALTAAKRKTI